MFEILLLENPLLTYLIIGLFFLAVGSLLNVIIYRVPLMLKAEWTEQCYELLQIKPENKIKQINLFYPRSFCPNCNKTVKAWQNIPLFSYLFLKGRCYYCRKSISLRYPFIELLTLILSIYCFLHFGMNLNLLFALLFIWIIICLIFIDFEHQLLPDSLTLSLLWLGLIANTADLFTTLPNAVLSAAGAYLALWIFVKLFYLLTGKVGMGHGDFKLFAAMGAWFGWTQLPLILVLSSFTGAVIGLIYLHLKNKSKDTAIPFGPFLCIAGLISLFWGHSLISWYLHFY
ncbi:prepilin peptidase [Legionella israelensis]|uniref:Prepilin leader peptidase/N-methyltransferase n=1 Tax=Legionella israelensis TaxID=454 RepID=A0A0W0VGZ1_9GAMM|nr:A24 family peptidase [Legionella israelensis]KTD19400.1 type 4 (IV) prepilin-like protein leader peptide processing enzyme PilD [Legionella israelensis]QBR84356.1 prepilin peptidase [Legionella israelensis]QBS08629.1 prepilin peptidase [Legionella israelensis]SCY09648.1 type 4 prepilin peptidase 1 . Aspartic peptidase. MEROPS family A24A [Legionella israelensis DSM 19235]